MNEMSTYNLISLDKHLCLLIGLFFLGFLSCRTVCSFCVSVISPFSLEQQQRVGMMTPQVVGCATPSCLRNSMAERVSARTKRQATRDDT